MVWPSVCRTATQSSISRDPGLQGRKNHKDKLYPLIRDAHTASLGIFVQLQTISRCSRRIHHDEGLYPSSLGVDFTVYRPRISRGVEIHPDKYETAANLAGKPIKGKVLEVQSAGGYTYLLIKNEQGEVWIALPESKVETGQEVIVSPGMMMKSFESKALNKTFDAIIFSSGLTDDMPPATVAAEGNPHASEDMQAPVDDAELAKLSGGSARAIVPAADEIKVKKQRGRTHRQLRTALPTLSSSITKQFKFAVKS